MSEEPTQSADEQNAATPVKPIPGQEKNTRSKLRLVIGLVWAVILTLVIVGFVFFFSVSEKRLGQWVELDKQVFGFGHAPGDLLSDGTIQLSQRSHQFADLHLKVLAAMFLWLVLFAPIPLLLRDKKVLSAHIWGVIGCIILFASAGFFYYSAWIAPNQAYANKYKLRFVPSSSKVSSYVDRLAESDVEPDEANELVTGLTWINMCSNYKLNEPPTSEFESLVKMAGDESKPKLSRLMAAVAVSRMMTTEELNSKKHFKEMKSAAESAKELKDEISQRHLVTLAKLTGAETGSNLAFE